MRKRLFSIIASFAMIIGLCVTNLHAKAGPDSKAIVNGIEYETLAAALNANKDVKDPVTVEIHGVLEWETGPKYNSTLFDMATDALTFKGVDPLSTLKATGDGVCGIGMDHGTVVYEDLTIIDSSYYIYENGENSWEFTYLEFEGNSIFRNVYFDDGVMFRGNSVVAENCQFVGHPNDSSKLGDVTMYGAWVANGTAEFTDCKFSGTRGLKMHEAYKTDISSVSVSSCSFIGLTEKPGIAIGDLNEDTVVSFDHSVFLNCQDGDQGLYMYETDTPTDQFTFSVRNSHVCFQTQTGANTTGMTHYDFIEATCAKEGQKAYDQCPFCNQIIDEEGNETDLQSLSIPATEKHVYKEGKCEVCGEPDYNNGFNYFEYFDDNGDEHLEFNKLVGYVDETDEYTLYVNGLPITVSKELKYLYPCSGKYEIGLGEDPRLSDETVASIKDTDEGIVVIPKKTGTTVLTVNQDNAIKTVTIKVVEHEPVKLIIENGVNGSVVIDSKKMTVGTHSVEYNQKLNMYTSPDPGYHFDHWIINGKSEPGLFGYLGGMYITSDQDMTIRSVFRKCDDTETRNAVASTCTREGYSGDTYCKQQNVLIEKGNVLPLENHEYVNHVCKVCGAVEEVRVEVSESINEEIAKDLTDFMKEVKVENVTEAITSTARNDLLKEYQNTTGTVELKVLNNVTITQVKQEIGRSSITFEIKPQAMIIVNGEVDKVIDLSNQLLNQNTKSIEVTLPTNGLEVKEIVHTSDEYPVEYIHDFKVNADKTVTFRISHFSSFTLNNTITQNSVVDTSDQSSIWLYGGIGACSLICAIALIVLRRKDA